MSHAQALANWQATESRTTSYVDYVTRLKSSHYHHVTVAELDLWLTGIIPFCPAAVQKTWLANARPEPGVYFAHSENKATCLAMRQREEKWEVIFVQVETKPRVNARLAGWAIAAGVGLYSFSWFLPLARYVACGWMGFQVVACAHAWRGRVKNYAHGYLLAELSNYDIHVSASNEIKWQGVLM